jgi:predicted phage tail protein
MLQMIQESDNLSEVKTSVAERFEKNIESKKKKNEKANCILERVEKKTSDSSEKTSSLVKEATDQFHIEDDYLTKKYAEEKCSFEMLYLREFLIELKYRLTDRNRKKEEVHNGKES